MKKTAWGMLLALVAMSGACSGDDTDPQTDTGGEDTGSEDIGAADTSADTQEDTAPFEFADDCDHEISPADESDAESLRTALITNVEDGDVVCLGPGQFDFLSELQLTTDGITLRGAGMDDTVLDFTNQDLGANGVLITADEVTMESLTVQNSPGDGV